VDGTNGDLAADLGAGLGMELFPWQRAVMDDLCAYRLVAAPTPDDPDRARQLPSYVTAGLDVPRQNGKNAILEVYEMYRLALDGWHVLHTAHRVKTAKKSFQRLCKYFTDDKHPEMQALVEKIRRTNGEEAIFLRNGGSIEFIARTNGSARGFDDIQLVVYDEAQELTDSQYDAITYTLAASSTGERQTLYMGTPPNETSPGTVFARQRANALGERNANVVWASWASPELPRRDAAFEDVIEDVYASNPSMGYVLDIEYTMSEFAGADIVGFAHERLDWWSPVANKAAAAIPPSLWRKTSLDAIGDRYKGKAALCVRFAPDGSSYALAGCKLGAGKLKGKAALELVEVGVTDNGMRDLAERLVAAKSTISTVTVDGLAGADALCGLMADLGAPRGYVTRPHAKDVIAATSGLMDGLKRGDVAHTPSEALDRAAAKCVRRAIGRSGGWGFAAPQGDETTQAEPIEAAALALEAAKTTKRNPRRKQRML
jgi:hypothetical protein